MIYRALIIKSESNPQQEKDQIMKKIAENVAFVNNYRSNWYVDDRLKNVLSIKNG